MMITDTAIHELYVLRWLLEEDYESVQIIKPRQTKFAGTLQDPKIIILKTNKQAIINIEIFVNCRYEYDIACEVVREHGVATLEQPGFTKVTQNGLHTYKIQKSWKSRSLDAYNLEIQDFINAVAKII